MYGGLKNKYKKLIDLIMARNPMYQLEEINTNNVVLSNTGMIFRLIEKDKKLHIYWVWHSLGSDQTYRLFWKFDENENQQKMYDIIAFDMEVQVLINDGLNRQQAIDLATISRTKNEEEKKRLVDTFSIKYPYLFK